MTTYGRCRVGTLTRLVSLVVGLLTTCFIACDHADGDGSLDGMPVGMFDSGSLPPEIQYASGSLAGYWIWSQIVKDGAVTREITAADLEVKIGPQGWSGCPDGIICTHYGIQRLAFTERGHSFFGNNVTTSSDWNYPSTFKIAGDSIVSTLQETYSCAHPNDDNQNKRTTYAHFYRDGNKLWIGSSSDKPLTASGDRSSGSWTVYRAISANDFYETYRLVKECYKGRSTRGSCHEACKKELTAIDSYIF